MLTEGIMAPGFSLEDQSGRVHTLEEYRGRKVVLYFYPKDMTAGCTKQACGFAGLYPRFQELGAVVLGVSRDSAASHLRFAEKYGLPFPLLADPDMRAIRAYDVWQEKKGGAMGVVRTTYIIGEDGTILQAFPNAKAGENPAQTLAALEG